MTTPWVSRPRWTCKYCNVTINDDVPSRSSHENGLRHKSNVERSLREAYKKSQRERTDEAQAKRELEKIERLAREAHAHDVTSSSSSTTSNTDSAVNTTTPTPTNEGKTTKWKPTDRFAAYGSALPTTLEEQRAKEEEKRAQDWQAKEEERRKEGTVGEWQVVQPSATILPTQQDSSSSASKEKKPSNFSVKEKKGEYKSTLDTEEEMEIVVKKRNRTITDTGRQQERERREREMLPSWQPLRLDTGISVKEEGVQAVPIRRLSDEEQSSVQLVEEGGGTKEVKEEERSSSDVPPSSSSMFKKRKTNAGAGAKKVRAVI